MNRQPQRSPLDIATDVVDLATELSALPSVTRLDTLQTPDIRQAVAALTHARNRLSALGAELAAWQPPVPRLPPHPL